MERVGRHKLRSKHNIYSKYLHKIKLTIIYRGNFTQISIYIRLLSDSVFDYALLDVEKRRRNAFVIHPHGGRWNSLNQHQKLLGIRIFYVLEAMGRLRSGCVTDTCFAILEK